MINLFLNNGSNAKQQIPLKTRKNGDIYRFLLFDKQVNYEKEVVDAEKILKVVS